MCGGEDDMHYSTLLGIGEDFHVFLQASAFWFSDSLEIKGLFPGEGVERKIIDDVAKQSLQISSIFAFFNKNFTSRLCVI